MSSSQTVNCQPNIQQEIERLDFEKIVLHSSSLESPLDSTAGDDSNPFLPARKRMKRRGSRVQSKSRSRRDNLSQYTIDRRLVVGVLWHLIQSSIIIFNISVQLVFPSLKGVINLQKVLQQYDHDRMMRVAKEIRMAMLANRGSHRMDSIPSRC